tara:strand:+ start:178 stop:357 length:180 start_codon:yes stop_codon:yes gene_type:complete
MDKLRVEPKAYHKKSTTDSTPITQYVDPELKKQMDAMMAGLVDTLNKNTSKKSKSDKEG